jgi:paraquat-inducible protein B
MIDLKENPFLSVKRAKPGRAGIVAAILLGATIATEPPATTESALAQTAESDRAPPAARPPALPVVGVPFLIRFAGTVRGLEPGAAVEVRGIRIGDVRSVGLEYRADSNSFVVPVVIELQPSLFPASGPHPSTAEETYAAADALVQRGLRAQVSDTRLLGGEAIVTLDIKPDTVPVHLGRNGAVPELPAGPTRREMITEQLQPLIDKIANAPLDQIFADAQASMAALKDLASGPELRGALTELRAASAELRGVVERLGTKSDALMDNLSVTMRSTNRLMGRFPQIGMRFERGC